MVIKPHIFMVYVLLLLRRKDHETGGELYLHATWQTKSLSLGIIFKLFLLKGDLFPVTSTHITDCYSLQDQMFLSQP